MPSSRPSRPHRGFSWAVREARARQEQEHLLAVEHDDGDHADSDGLYPPNSCWYADNPNPPDQHADLPVYTTIHKIRRDIINSIDDPYSLEQLKGPRMNISVVRPLVDSYYNLQDVSIIYCLLTNRTQFIREQSFATHHQTVNLTRALLCELLAEKILRRYNEHNPGPKGLLLLANILVAGFEPFQNAPDEVIDGSVHAMHWAYQRRHNLTPSQSRSSPGNASPASPQQRLNPNAWSPSQAADRKLTALEIAIICEAKSFLACSATQKVVDAIYTGKLVYTPSSFIDIIPDHWKYKPISLYDPRRASLLNQYRLIVPRTRNVIEVVNFCILLLLYVLLMVHKPRTSGGNVTAEYTTYELLFDVYAAGWVLDQFASILEHGWQVYSQNLWSFLDVGFSAIYITYLIMRMHAFARYHSVGDHEAFVKLSHTALDILSVGAPILIPRLAFNLMSENMLFVSLRAMMSDFMTLTLLAVWSFGGFLLSMKWLHSHVHSSLTISKWMVWIWFGLDGTGIQRSPDFHPILGPTLMVLFAFLGNTLFLTILVSMLSNTFAMIVGNATAEIQYRRAVLTFEGVKSDAIFYYMPPFNMAALALMLPARFLLGPRRFHKVNAFVTRAVNAPLLAAISLYERRTLWMSDRARHRQRDERRPRLIDWAHAGGPSASPRSFGGMFAQGMAFWDFSRFSVHGDVQAVFDTEPPQVTLDAIAEMDDSEHGERGRGHTIKMDFHRQFGGGGKSKAYAINGGNKKVGPTMGVTSSPEPVDYGTVMESRRQSMADRAKLSKQRSTAKTKGPSATKASQKKESPAALLEEFGSSSEDSHRRRAEESEDASGSSSDDKDAKETKSERQTQKKPKAKKKQKKQRLDSLAYAFPISDGFVEANERLTKLEKGMQRIEEMLAQLTRNQNDDIEAEDEDMRDTAEADEALKEEEIQMRSNKL